MNQLQDYTQEIKRVNETAVTMKEIKSIPFSARLDYMLDHDDISFKMYAAIDIDDFKSITDDEKKTKLLLKICIKKEMADFFKLASTIDNKLYRMKLKDYIIRDDYDYAVENFDLQCKLYNKILSDTANMTEEEKYRYISNIDDKDIKTFFFYETEDLSNRQIIVDSMHEKVDDRLKPYINLSQKMILDFFEKNCSDFTEKEKQELEMIFRRTDVEYTNNKLSNPKAVGLMDIVDYKMSFSPLDKIQNFYQLVFIMLHEYGHAISMKNYKMIEAINPEAEKIDEGMSDTFSDLVCKSYSKDNIVKLGKDSDTSLKEQDVITNSSYKEYNSLIRTLLYTLEKDNTDKKALFNYYFGDKLKFFEMTLGNGYTQYLPKDFNTNFLVPGFNFFNYLYNHKADSFKDINVNSDYVKNNSMIKELNEKVNKDRQVDEEVCI